MANYKLDPNSFPPGSSYSFIQALTEYANNIDLINSSSSDILAKIDDINAQITSLTAKVNSLQKQIDKL